MAIKERGVKRTCQACGGIFYDLLNDPIICPKCGAEYDPESILKSRKTRLPTNRPPWRPYPLSRWENAELRKNVAIRELSRIRKIREITKLLKVKRVLKFE